MNSSTGMPLITPWDAVLESGSLRCLRSEMRWKDFYYQARIEQQESDGSWKKIGLLDSKIHIDWPNYWPKQENTRIFLQDRLVAAIETQTDGRILTVDGVATWRFDEAEDTRILGIESGLPAICLKSVSGAYWRGGLMTAIQDAASGIEIARFQDSTAFVPVLRTARGICAPGDAASRRGRGATAMCDRLLGPRLRDRLVTRNYFKISASHSRNFVRASLGRRTQASL